MSRRKLLSGSAWNFFGQALPLAVAVISIPWLIRLIGLERFGFLALAWTLVGYASILDLGIGKAVIRTMSGRLARQDTAGANASGAAGLLFLLGLGITLGLAILLAAPSLVERVLKVPPALQTEALTALRMLALSIPFVMLTGGYVGVMSAHQDFKRMNLIRAQLSLLTYLLPLLLALAGLVALPWLMAAILLVRGGGTAVYAWAAKRNHGFQIAWRRPAPDQVQELFKLGGWMTVSNLVGPLLTYVDRLLMGALVPLRSVGLYAAPYDLLTRLMVVPYSMLSAYFPIASGLKPGSAEGQQALFDVVRWLFVAMFPVVLVVVAFAHPAMTLWLGAEPGPLAGTVLQILIAGLIFNVMAQGPATLILAAGHPRNIALLHLVELPLFIGVLWFLTSRYGIVGTAASVALRFVLDALAVGALALHDFAAAPRVRWGQQLALLKPTLLPFVLGVALLGLVQFSRSWWMAALTAAVGLAVFAAYAWPRLLRPGERAGLVAFLRRR
ncbi:MAG: flippase [Rubrivivax sp.]|nr:flippase [Rubrivivax sp.]